MKAGWLTEQGYRSGSTNLKTQRFLGFSLHEVCWGGWGGGIAMHPLQRWGAESSRGRGLTCWGFSKDEKALWGMEAAAVTTPFPDIFLSVSFQHNRDALTSRGLLQRLYMSWFSQRTKDQGRIFSSPTEQGSKRKHQQKSGALPPPASKRTWKWLESCLNLGHLTSPFSDRPTLVTTDPSQRH